MSAYPGLHPSGFVEFDSDCSGPRLYRSQPSRESKGVLLNEYMEKYNVGQYKGGDFLRLATDLKSMSRQWKRLPNDIKVQFVNLMLESNSDMSKDLAKSLEKSLEKSREKSRENFGESDPDSMSGAGNTCGTTNVFNMIVISIISLVIGFLVAYVGSS